MNETINKIIEGYKLKEEKKQSFIKNKEYLTQIELVLDKDRCNEDRELWTDETDLLFSFLYDHAEEICLCEEYSESFFIKYKNTYLELFEIHGQGCFRSITIANDTPPNYVSFDDIVTYEETGKEPYKNTVLKIVERSLKTLAYATQNDYIEEDGDYLSVDKILKYLNKNLWNWSK